MDRRHWILRERLHNCGGLGEAAMPVYDDVMMMLAVVVLFEINCKTFNILAL